ncbi:MAG: phage portal protein [Porphyromonadaceae bacterium]|nr:phage portal protein [Porphyromonadaceae bacterium]
MNENTLKELISLSPEKAIEALKAKSVSVPKWADLEKHYDRRKHDVMTDQNALKDKKRSDGGVDKSTRVSLALEKLASRRMSEFCFAIPVKRVYSGIDSDQTKSQIVRAIEAIYKNARIDTINLRRGRSFFASCEVCTVWFVKEQPNASYGFDSKYKLKCKSYSPMDGYSLYPLFDDMDDMIAMSFGYDKKEGDDKVSHFETYTIDGYYHWIDKGDGWELKEPPANIKLGKIPAVYMSRQEAIYEDITDIRSELEFLLSRNGNVLAYNSAPAIKIKGKVEGQEDRDEAQRIFRLEQGGDMDYVGWTQSVDANKLQADALHNSIFMLLQLPDLSFENMKSLGNIGFDARQTLLTDAHLKVGSESGDLVEALEREASIIKAFLKLMNPSWSKAIDEVDIEHIITPYIQGDELAEIKKRITANGGKPIESQRESIARYGWSDDPDETMRQIQEEAQEEAKANRIGSFEGAE